MDPDSISQLAREALRLTILTSAPLVGVAALVGVLFGFLQALTQLQDQTTTFAFKLLAVLGLLAVLVPWLSASLMTYAERSFTLILTLQ